MFTQTWKKYLPVIAILMKRSANSEQTLDMNHIDFEKAAGGRKLKFSFSGLTLNNGRMDNTAKYAPIARELVQVLQDHDLTRVMIRNQRFEFSLNNDFQLLIKNTTPPASPAADLPEMPGETVNSESAE